MCPRCGAPLQENCRCTFCKTEFVTHPFPPVFSKHAQTLILGSIPSPDSRKEGFYYMNSRNRFWKVLSRVYGAMPIESIDDRKKLILNNNLALWDVLASCWITGAGDHSILFPTANDLSPLIAGCAIKRILCTGEKAFSLYQKLCAQAAGITALRLPSTSARNAAFSEDRLFAVYAAALNQPNTD
ncbi:MAG: DNA-deoxyinosine glycosylase [Spirochaetaceae bacterium]|jgi:hypoxanthine-DNA glycosylase|nr:DNA-deoxyinosine glycosylase [Spirochaetaceae bacterium]